MEQFTVDFIMSHLGMLAILTGAGFCAAFIDSIVGGGGLISVPAILLTGLPPSMALGTNKGASVVSAATSSYVFIRSGKVNWKLLRMQLPFTLVGSIVGTLLVVNIPPLYLKPILIILLGLVLLFVIFKQDWGEESHYKGQTTKILIFSLVFAFAIGAYDGFIGPGTGTFLIFAFLFIGFDFLTAAGNAKVLNFASNVGALIIFIALGKVVFLYSGAMAIGQFCGASVGARLAIRKGTKLVRLLFLLVTSTMILKLAYEYYKTLV